MTDNVVTSKEVLTVIITFIVAQIVKTTGVEVPITAEQIYMTGLALAGIIRVLWTNESIRRIFPQGWI